MKKILCFAALLALCGFAVPAVKAADIVPITISTYAVSDAAHIGAEISGAASVDKFVFTNSTTTATTVTVYKNCASTTTVTAVLTVVVPSVTAAAGGTVSVDFTPSVVNNPFRYSDMCFRKVTDAADTYVKVSVHYR